MSFELFISLVILFVFTVLPSLIKLLSKKGKADSRSSNTGRQTIVEKISGQVQQVFKELEAQAQQRTPAGEDSDDEENIWAKLAEEQYEEEQPDEQILWTEGSAVPPPMPPPIQIEKVQQTFESKERQPSAVKSDPIADISSRTSKPAYVTSQSTVRVFRKDPLHNAVIWAEVLKKPLALRED